MPTPTPSELAGYIRTFDREAQTTLKLLRLFPADKLALKPGDKSGTAGQVIWTLVLGQMVVSMLLRQSDLSPGDMPKPPATLPEMIAAFESAHADTMAALARLTEAEMEAPVTMPVAPRTMGQVRRSEAMWMFLYDGIHHRGQLTVYQRMAGGKVPSIYGPTADEPWF